VGCPIRRSRDHQSLASPPGFSQRATSFIASQCQGIHQMPLICSIHSAVRTPKEGAQHPGTPPRTVANPKCSPIRQPRQYYPLDQQLSRRGPCPRTASFHEDTLSNGPITRRFTPQAEPSASVTFTNSLHPINQHPPGISPATRPTAPGRDPRENPVFSECHWITGPITDTRSIPISDLCRRISGGERDRTDDLLLAKQALSQLSYTPVSGIRNLLADPRCLIPGWWAREDLNLRPHAYQARALTS
jgi:hypothetical protein